MSPDVKFVLALQAIGLLIFAVGFSVALIYLKGLLDQANTLLRTLNEKIIDVEGELKPILRDVEITLRNIEPLTKELGEKGEKIGAMLENLERVSDDAQATTGAIRHGIVPFAHALSGIFAGLSEGAKVLGEYTRRNTRDASR